MQSLIGKNTGDPLSAAEWNQLPGEVQNVIEGLGITLSAGDLDQLGKAIAGYSSHGDFYTDSGAADAYVLSALSLKETPPAYVDGFRARFTPANQNTGASTVNIAALGSRPLTLPGGRALVGNEVIAGRATEVVYVQASARFELVESDAVLSTTYMAAYGMTGDGATNDSTDFAAAVAATPSGGTLLAEPGKVYYFGALTGDTIKQDLTSPIIIDWNGSKILIDGDNSGAFTATTFVRANDVAASMKNYIFEDTGFDLVSGPSRGVQPFSIFNEFANTEGCQVGPFHVIKGQSMLTAFSADPANFRARGIELIGPCTADNVYYGVNCARNGDDLNGTYTIESCNRAYFCYGVNNHDVRWRVETGQPASANVFVSHSNSATAALNTDTKNIKIRGSFGVLDGPIVIADQPRDLVAGEGIYKSIDIECEIDAIGANLQNGATNNFPLIKIGAFDTNSALITTEITQKIDDLRIKLIPADTINTHGKLTLPVTIEAPSPNYGTFEFPIETQCGRGSDVFPENVGGDTFRTAMLKTGPWYFRAINGALTDGASGVTRSLFIPLKYVAPRQRNSDLGVTVEVVAFRDTTSGLNVMAEYYIIGSVASTGAITIVDAFQKHQRDTGGSAAVIAFAAADPYSSGVNDHIEVSIVDALGAAGLNNAAAQLSVRVAPIS